MQVFKLNAVGKYILHHNENCCRINMQLKLPTLNSFNCLTTTLK